ncbi:T9SS type A sorting domain-containing protein [Lishizhenia sp.]|uniref:T9SS type A sorting domain-containing protein n=1 Tax=Lishizhenia sp. TaxID=2497594 RepID=UPI00299E9D6E|nr:T9SS type A sorting domain-containing protein [Lishizhenia sp.]MDX1446237.1 T9SS type A sorting domain-containing protein [Lishizhenia sp.]
MKALFTCLAIFILFGSTHTLFAQNWTGNVDSVWNNPSNWSAWPLNGLDIEIDPINYTGVGASPFIDSTSLFVPNSIEVLGGAVLTINEDLSIGSSLLCSGVGSSVILNSDNLTIQNVQGNIHFLNQATGSLNSVQYTSGGNFILDQGAEIELRYATIDTLLVLNGAQLTVLNGVVNVDFTRVANGNTQQSSGIAVESANFNNSGNTIYEVSSGNYSPYFKTAEVSTWASVYFQDTFKVEGSGNYSGTVDLDFYRGYGDFNKAIINNASNDVFFNLNIAETHASSFMTNILIDLDHPEDSILVYNNELLFHNDIGSNDISKIESEGVIDISSDDFRFLNGVYVSGSGHFQFNDVGILSDTSLQQNTQNPIYVSGNLKMTNGLGLNSQGLVLNGDGDQVVQNIFYPGTDDTLALNYLTLDKPSGKVTPFVHLKVMENLSLIEGVLDMSDSLSLIFNDQATHTGANNLSYVKGEVIKLNTQNFTFPLGSAGVYAPIRLLPASSNQNYSANYYRNNPGNLSNFTTPTAAVSSLDYWEINCLNGSIEVQVGLNWEDASQHALGSCSNLNLLGLDGNSWLNNSATVSGICNGNNSGELLSTNSNLNYQRYTLGLGYQPNFEELPICFGDSVWIGGMYYTDSSSALETYTDVNGNDSIVMYDLQVRPKYYQIDSVALCNDEVYQVGNINYSNVEGIFLDTLQSIYGCDSVVESRIKWTGIEVEAEQVFNYMEGIIDFVAADTFDYTYQWLDCNNGLAPIPGETDYYYAPDTSGLYTVVVELEGCIDTSACVQYIRDYSGVDDVDKPRISIYPNPNQGVIFCELPQAYSRVNFEIVDIKGGIVYQKEFSNSSKVQLATELTPGVYVLRVSTPTKRWEERLIIEK